MAACTTQTELALALILEEPQDKHWNTNIDNYISYWVILAILNIK